VKGWPDLQIALLNLPAGWDKCNTMEKELMAIPGNCKVVGKISNKNMGL